MGTCCKGQGKPSAQCLKLSPSEVKLRDWERFNPEPASAAAKHSHVVCLSMDSSFQPKSQRRHRPVQGALEAPQVGRLLCEGGAASGYQGGNGCLT